MQTIFDFTDYKKWIKEQKKLPSGRGLYRRIATRLKMHTSMVSQVFSGDRDLTSENGLEISEFFGLNTAETEYLLCLIEISRAGTQKLKNHRLKQLDKLRTNATQVGTRLPKGKELDDAAKATFYSQWYYSAISLCTSLGTFHDANSIAQRLNVPVGFVRDALSFLVEHGLVRSEGKLLAVGNTRTHVPQSSPMAARHHANWRLKAIERSTHIKSNELMFTSPMTLSAKDAAAIRRMVLSTISDVAKVVDPSPSESAWCFNVDLFEI